MVLSFQNSGAYNKGPWPNGKYLESSLLDGLLMLDEEILYYSKDEIDDFMNRKGLHLLTITILWMQDHNANYTTPLFT